MAYVTRSEARKRTAQIAFTPQCNSQEWWNEYLQKVENLMRKEEEDQREACMKAFGIQLPPHVAKSFLEWIKDQEKLKPDDICLEKLKRNSNAEPNNFQASVYKRLEYPPIAPSTVPFIKYEEAALDYHPDHLYHNLCSDSQLQNDLYGKDFTFDFEDWLKHCWFKPKFETANIYDVLNKMQVQQFMPYSYRMCNPTGLVEITIKVQVDLAGKLKTMYMVVPHVDANETLNKNKPKEISKAIADALEVKMINLPQDLEGLSIVKIQKVNVRQEQKPHSNGVMV